MPNTGTADLAVMDKKIKPDDQLTKAVQQGDLNLAQQALENGADPNPRANRAGGGTPLHIDCAYGLAECVVLLLSLGADSSLKDSKGRTSANFARMNGHNELAEIVGRGSAMENIQLDHSHHHVKAKKYPKRSCIYDASILIILSLVGSPSALNISAIFSTKSFIYIPV